MNLERMGEGIIALPLGIGIYSFAGACEMMCTLINEKESKEWFKFIRGDGLKIMKYGINQISTFGKIVEYLK